MDFFVNGKFVMYKKIFGIWLLFSLFLLSGCSNSIGAYEWDNRHEFFSTDIYLLTPDTLSEFPPSGFYDSPFVINYPDDEMRCAEGGLKPTADSPMVSEYAFYSTKTVRCASFKSGSLSSAEIIRTYMFESSPTIPAVFLTADPNSLFDPDTGIYEDGKEPEGGKIKYWENYWQNKEIPVFVELLELNASQPNFAENAGLQIFGRTSRRKAKKSVAIAFRKEYGAKHLHYALFPEYPNLKKFNNFVLRNNGSNFRNDYIRDRLASSLSEGLGVDYQKGRFVVVYYNGVYFGIHDLREKTNKHFIETNYGIPSDGIDLVSAENQALAGSSNDYVALMAWLKSNHLDSKEKYDYVSRQIDIDNYINYMLVEIFANNRDWPGNNLKKWRGTNPKTKWKWILYDLDSGFGYGDGSNNVFEFVTEENKDSGPNGTRHTLLLRRLLENNDFKASFINRMVVLLQSNFESSRILLRIEKMMKEIEREISRDQSRWDQNVPKMRRQLDVIMDFAKKRQDVVYEEMRDFFSLGQTVEVSLSVKGRGSIRVHGLNLDASSMKLKFFRGFPVEISAVPANGGIFTGWSDGINEEIRTIMPEKQASLTALFK